MNMTCNTYCYFGPKTGRIVKLLAMHAIETEQPFTQDMKPNIYIYIYIYIYVPRPPPPPWLVSGRPWHIYTHIYIYIYIYICIHTTLPPTPHGHCMSSTADRAFLRACSPANATFVGVARFSVMNFFFSA